MFRIRQRIITLAVVFMICLLGCSKDSPTISSEGNCNRIGAICNDGTRSSATGSGACSHHGGVDFWICK